MKTNTLLSRVLGVVLLYVTILDTTQAQTIMFDDFTYSGINDNQLGTFNKWRIINGVSGPPEGAYYSRDNVGFINDPNNPENKLMTLSTTVNGQTDATTHSRIETAGFEYFEGTYAARVYFSDLPNTYKDANIQTFYTIVSSQLGTDGSRYSELDFEYMAADKWGISPDNKVLYLTAWNRYIANPWQAWKRYFAYQQSYAGWHTFVVSATDGTNVKFWIDGQYMGSMATTDNDGSSVYPRNPMQVAFANWIWNNVVGPNNSNRTTTMQVDWVLFEKDNELNPQQVNAKVNSLRSQGVQRRNLLGDTYVVNPNQLPTIGITSPANGAEYAEFDNISITANASDPDGYITQVEFYNGNNLLGVDNASPYQYDWQNLSEGNYTLTAKATDNRGAVVTSSPIYITVTGNTLPDLALGRPVTVSSVETAGLPGAYAVDGNSGTRWASEYSDPQWISVDLGATYDIERVRLNWEVAHASAYQVQVSDNGLNWSTIYSTSSGNGGIDNLTGLQGTGRYIRVYGTVRGTQWGYSLWDFEVYGTPGVSNESPDITLTSPAGGTSYESPATINISATATDSDGSVSKVEFYNGSQLLGTDYTSPYSYVWSGVGAGSYSITAVATDDDGATTASGVVNITVTNPPTSSILIQAEDYDNMGGVQLEQTTDAGGGQNVGWIDQGDWMYYGDINVLNSGYYTVEFRVASLTGAGMINFHLNEGGTITDLTTLDIPVTNGWQNWTTIQATVYLDAGARSFGIYAPEGGWNINWFRLNYSGEGLPSQELIDAQDIDVVIYPNPVEDIVHITSNDGVISVSVVNSSGSVMYSGEEVNAIDMSSYPAGTYNILVVTELGYDSRVVQKY